MSNLPRMNTHAASVTHMHDHSNVATDPIGGSVKRLPAAAERGLKLNSNQQQFLEKFEASKMQRASGKTLSAIFSQSPSQLQPQPQPGSESVDPGTVGQKPQGRLRKLDLK